MADLYGLGACVGLGRQSAFLTAVSRTAWFPVSSCSLQNKIKYGVRDTLANNVGSFNARKRYVESQTAGGTVDLLLQYEGFGLWLEALLGATPVTTGPSSGLYTHVFAIGPTLPPGLTVEFQRGTGTSELYTGCRVAKGTIKAEAGKELKCSFELIARSVDARTTAVTPTFTGSRDLVVSHLEAGTLLWDSVAYTVDMMEVTVDNKIAARQSIGSALPAEIPRTGMMDVRIKLELVWSSDAFLVGLVADTESDAVIEFASAIAAGTKFIVGGNKCAVDEVSDPITTAGVVKQTVTLVCQADSGSEGLTLTVINTQSNALAA